MYRGTAVARTWTRRVGSLRVLFGVFSGVERGEPGLAKMIEPCKAKDITHQLSATVRRTNGTQSMNISSYQCRPNLLLPSVVFDFQDILAYWLRPKFVAQQEVWSGCSFVRSITMIRAGRFVILPYGARKQNRPTRTLGRQRSVFLIKPLSKSITLYYIYQARYN